MHGVVLYIHRWCNFNNIGFAVYKTEAGGTLTRNQIYEAKSCKNYKLITTSNSKEILTAMRVMVVSIGSRGSHIPAMTPRRYISFIYRTICVLYTEIIKQN